MKSFRIFSEIGSPINLCAEKTKDGMLFFRKIAHKTTEVVFENEVKSNTEERAWSCPECELEF